MLINTTHRGTNGATSGRNGYIVNGPVPTFNMISRNNVPVQEVKGGRESIVTRLPFWEPLISQLKAGLGRMEAVDLQLCEIEGFDGEPVSVPQLIHRIRYQFAKLNLFERYSLVEGSNGKSGHLYIVDNESAAMLSKPAQA